jgi:hypothetical protein
MIRADRRRQELGRGGRTSGSCGAHGRDVSNQRNQGNPNPLRSGAAPTKIIGYRSLSMTNQQPERPPSGRYRGERPGGTADAQRQRSESGKMWGDSFPWWHGLSQGSVLIIMADRAYMPTAYVPVAASVLARQGNPRHAGAGSTPSAVKEATGQPAASVSQAFPSSKCPEHDDA